MAVDTVGAAGKPK
jgi:26S proteasome regulatory subunit N1